MTPPGATTARPYQAPPDSEPAQTTRGVGELAEAAPSVSAAHPLETQPVQSQAPVRRAASDAAAQQATGPSPERVIQSLPEREAVEDEELVQIVEDASPGASPETPRLPLQVVPLEEALFGNAATSPQVPQPERHPTLPAPGGESAEAKAAPTPESAVRRVPLEEHDPTFTPVHEGGPLMQVQLVRRAAEQAAAPAQTGATPARASEPTAQAAEPDLDRLAEEVYRRLRERLRVERERHGRAY